MTAKFLMKFLHISSRKELLILVSKRASVKIGFLSLYALKLDDNFIGTF